jgi:hypothetical protein
MSADDVTLIKDSRTIDAATLNQVKSERGSGMCA